MHGQPNIKIWYLVDSFGSLLGLKRAGREADHLLWPCSAEFKIEWSYSCMEVTGRL